MTKTPAELACVHTGRHTHKRGKGRRPLIVDERNRPTTHYANMQKYAAETQARGEVKRRGVKKGGHRGKTESRESVRAFNTVSGQHVSHTVLYLDLIAFHLFI